MRVTVSADVKGTYVLVKIRNDEGGYRELKKTRL